MKRMLFIMNPIAGKRKAKGKVIEIVDTFNRAGYQVDLHITCAAGDGKEQIIARAETLDAVVCCGGDGTFNETVAGVLACGRRIPIGYIPAGTTNDFAHTICLPLDPVKAAKVIAEGTPHPLDMGMFEDANFTYIASFGAFTKASYSTPQGMKNALGHAAYVLEGIRELPSIHKIQAKFEMDGEVVEDKFLFGAVCNTTSVAGVMKLDKSRVDLRDGLFEVLLVRPPKNIAELTSCIHSIRKRRYDHRMITFCSAANVTVEMSEDEAWTLDGEKMDGKPQLHIKNLHEAVDIIM